MIDNADDHVWLTYDEAAQALGIKADSVRRRAAARKWPKRPGNDRTVKVGIPRDAIPDRTPDAAPAYIPDITPDEIGDIRADLAASRAENAGLRDRLADTQAERDRLAKLREKALEPRPGILSRILGR
jgi:hypothetical protein